ncbi:MAG: hypothetical protein WC809_00140 [Sinimarinibacterium sp.]|jgi:hypothetical protein
MPRAAGRCRRFRKQLCGPSRWWITPDRARSRPSSGSPRPNSSSGGAICTTLYIAPATGQIVARRNDLWRIFDFVWMLLIMDYDECENFNHPPLIATATTALLFVLTGLCMLGYAFLPR